MAENYTRSKSVDIKPYQYGERKIDMKMEKASVDGEKLDEVVLPEKKEIHLEEWKDFDEAKLEFNIRVDKSSVKELIPENEDSNLSLFLVLRSNSTFLRDRIRELDFAEEQKEEIDLDSELLRGKVHIFPIVVRNKDAGEDVPGYSTVKGEKVADGKKWLIRIDKEEGPSNSLNSEWESFSDIEDEHEMISSDDLHYLDLDSDPANPTLLLNEDYPGVQSVMESEGVQTYEARLREVFFDVVSQSIFIKLFRRAIVDFRDNREFEYEWHEAIVAELQEFVFPEMDEEQIRKEIWESKSDMQKYENLMNSVHQAVQRNDEILDHMKKMVEVDE